VRGEATDTRTETQWAAMAEGCVGLDNSRDFAAANLRRGKGGRIRPQGNEGLE